VRVLVTDQLAFTSSRRDANLTDRDLVERSEKSCNTQWISSASLYGIYRAQEYLLSQLRSYTLPIRVEFKLSSVKGGFRLSSEVDDCGGLAGDLFEVCELVYVACN